MKVLDFESIKKYDYMANSLAFIAFGELEEAIISAYEHLNSDAGTVNAKIDISLYIAKIYSKMGEFHASTNLLFRLLDYNVEQGRVYALLAYNFFREGDNDAGNLYKALMHDYNASHNNILSIDREYEEEINLNSKNISHNVHYRYQTMIDNAWAIAISGDTKRAREIAYNIDDVDDIKFQKFELIASLDIADNVNSDERKRLIDVILASDIRNANIMNIVYLLERNNDYDSIIKICEKAIHDKLCTSRLAYMYAIALNNIGKKTLSLKVLARLDKVYGYVFPYIKVARRFITENRRLHIDIYKDENTLSTLDLLRDSEICRVVLSNDLSTWIDDDDIIAMIYSMYQDGKISKVVEVITEKLVSSHQGRRLLMIMLLDSELRSAKMKVYIAKNLLKFESHLMVVYENVINTCDYVENKNLSEKERMAERDMVAFNLLSGN